MATQVDNYIKYYHLQNGGRLPVFMGQDGDGIGDMLRGLLGRAIPFLFPVVQGALNTFMDSAQKGISEGKSVKDVLKDTLNPTLKSVVGGVGEQIRNYSQRGSGRKRRRIHRKKIKARRVYKGKKKYSKKQRKIRRLNFDSNF